MNRTELFISYLPSITSTPDSSTSRFRRREEKKRPEFQQNAEISNWGMGCRDSAHDILETRKTACQNQTESPAMPTVASPFGFLFSSFTFLILHPMFFDSPLANTPRARFTYPHTPNLLHFELVYIAFGRRNVREPGSSFFERGLVMHAIWAWFA
jgi:hypothetical protein